MPVPLSDTDTFGHAAEDVLGTAGPIWLDQALKE